MTVKSLIRETLEMANWITREYLKDFSDADILVRSLPGCNHIAWQLGHLITSERKMLSEIGCEMPALPVGFETAHSKESSTSDDPKKFAKKDEYLALLRKMHDAMLIALDKTPDADLDKPAPESMRDYAPTVGSVFNLVGTHEMMHSGQFVALRRKLGKPVVM